MTDEQIQITALTEMFLGLGQEPTPERIAYYARLLKNVPVKYIRVACDHAVVASKSGFPPSPGEIIAQAERIHRDSIINARIKRDAPRNRVEDNPAQIAELIDLALRKAGA